MVFFRLKCLTAALGLLFFAWLEGQNYDRYTLSNGFAHNDYLQRHPLMESYALGFGLIEVDLCWNGGELMVAHEKETVREGRTFNRLYLEPLARLWKEGKARPVSFLVDLKTSWQETLPEVVRAIEAYPEFGDQVTWVISGDRPPKEKFSEYPSFIKFDGKLGETYRPEELAKVALFSEDFRLYSSWNGKGQPKAQEQHRIRQAVSWAHDKGKPIRFWGTPDEINAWHGLMGYDVDYISTDQPAALAAVLERMGKSSYRSRIAPVLFSKEERVWRKEGKKCYFVYCGRGFFASALCGLYGERRAS
ncbi:hypothetical protein [Bergeyella sp. RCAD1439]|uniref:hypothetical protein n=1 Tax=Bergeyella anatis TaxID=3113737 RepID=UPI002E1888EA|nr:hypothetical protein [Bergeyella sp. RCAD1439]